MSLSKRSIYVELHSDIGPENDVRVCGPTKSLGMWEFENAPSLSYDKASKLYKGLISLDESSLDEPYWLEYKLVVRFGGGSGSVLKSPNHASATVSGQLLWQNGPNRRVYFPSRHLSSKIAVNHTGNEVRQDVVINWYIHLDGTQLILDDPYLNDHRSHLKDRYRLYQERMGAMESFPGGFDNFTRGYEYYGFTRGVDGTGTPGIYYREWAPGTVNAFLMGDFNNWNRKSHQMVKNEFGVFSIFLPDINPSEGIERIAHDSFVKLVLTFPDGSEGTRVPAWIHYATYDRNLNEYVGKYYNFNHKNRHMWKHPRVRVSLAYSMSDASMIEHLERRSGVEGNEIAPPAVLGKPLLTSAGSYMANSVSTSPVGASSREEHPLYENCKVLNSSLKIYEAHVGMSSEEQKIASYRYFADEVLPRIHALGYNCVQLMAIAEHSYYGSFGYHVNQFLCPSSRFGTPDDLKYLVDRAHSLGLAVLMDCVLSHANKNVNDGLSNFDGTEYAYFHAGARGLHPLWDSRLFDYSQPETLRLLLSSLRFFAEEFRFDGFRFDGVTSMLYHHHGMGVAFSGHYNEYFGGATDLDACVFLAAANALLHSLPAPCLSIAEDVSGMPGLARPLQEGGLGFDMRLAMAVPDVWIKLLKETRDEDWDMSSLVWTLCNRRHLERVVAYCESHDQALVGDKTIAFWLMDKAMYTNMSTIHSSLPRGDQHDAIIKTEHSYGSNDVNELIISRGIALHKLIRGITHALGGDAWMAFMGNEWGHPEWVDFPRQGNGWSFAHCRRLWSLVDDKLLRYKFLNDFDKALQHLEQRFPWLSSKDCYVSTKHQDDKVIVFDRATSGGTLVFIFNFHADKSFSDYLVGVPLPGRYNLVLDSDTFQFGGHGRVAPNASSFSDTVPFNGRPHSMKVYSPSRTLLVYAHVPLAS